MSKNSHKKIAKQELKKAIKLRQKLAKEGKEIYKND